MFKKKDDIMTFIVIIIVCILCIIIALVLNYSNNYEKLEKVDDYDVFFANVSIVNKYLSFVANDDKLALDSLLDEKYKSNNILDNSNYTVLSSFEVSSMDYVKINKDFVYYIQGKIYNSVYDSVRELVDDDFKMVMIKDTSENNYALYPVTENVEDVINGIRWINIKNNEYNDFGVASSINKEKVCSIYFSNYMNYVYNDIGYAYELISDDMKKIYADKNKYTNYIYDNFSSLSSIADRCKLDEYEDMNVYTVIDTKGNTYKFTESSIMKYNVDFYLNENE